MRGNPVTMSSGLSWKLCLILLVLINLFECGRGQDFLNPHVCLNTGNYTANSTYIRNLNATLSALSSSNASQYGFYSASVGQGQDRAHAVALCRADTRIDQCRSCVANAAIELLQLCPSQKQAIRWYEMCMLHYSDQPITGNPTNIPTQGLINTADVDNPAKFRQDRTALLDFLRLQTANGSSLIKVGAGRWTMNDSNIIYAMLQCIPTLSPEECNDCLIQATQGLSGTAPGARQLRASCTLRYELYPFYNETRLRELNVVLPELPNSPPPAGTGGKRDENTAKIAVRIVVPIVVCLILAACAVFFLRKRRTRLPEIPENPEEISTVESLQYDFERISAATNDFADANKLGEGGFGSVYKGTLLNGQEIAVKRLSRESGQGDKEFKNEVLLVARLQHRNLVRLLGFSLEGTERLLIYEYVQNASLDQFIFDPVKGSQLDWERRYKIIGGIARGVLYLHEDSRLRIIHRDLKASNVLLDGDMNPKVADFGMARLFGHDETQGSTSKVVGTYGYMAPEYAIYGQYSIKSDVFSFGVLVLEIISGRRNIMSIGENIEDILSFVWKNWCAGTMENIVDPVLRGGTSVQEMLRCIQIALLCVQENPADRPTMNSILVMLSSSTVTLTVPLEPAFVLLSHVNDAGNKVYVSNGTDSSKESKIKEYISEGASPNEMSVSEFGPR